MAVRLAKSIGFEYSKHYKMYIISLPVFTTDYTSW